MQYLQNQDLALCQDTKITTFFHFLIVKEIYKHARNIFMSSKIFCGIIFLLVISVSTVFAQESLISVQTDDLNYDEGDTIVISGQVTTVIGSTPITLQLFIEGNMVEIEQITVAQDGTYSHTVLAEGPLWKKQGEYIARVSYGAGNIAEVEFSYIPEREAVVNTEIFEVDAGPKGTFDVEYSIKGGTVKDIIVNSNNFSLEVLIETTDYGSITLDLPRDWIGAEKQDGKDEMFIILIDGINVAYQESAVFSELRVITINFEEDDSKIEIIGTYVIPEFGTIVMMILMIGIMTTIIITRNKFQIKI